jgi:hypothetical protein
MVIFEEMLLFVVELYFLILFIFLLMNCFYFFNFILIFANYNWLDYFIYLTFKFLLLLLRRDVLILL